MIFDLTLQTGWPPALIGRLPESYLKNLARYASQKGFPMRRLEYGLARIAQLIAQTMGGDENATVQQFLFDAHHEASDEPEEEATEDEIEDMAAYIMGEKG